jgi:N-carbamoyl-L-amino-acid hydrolase
VRLEVDIRDVDLARRDGLLGALRAVCQEIGARRKVAVRQETIYADAPAQSSPAVVDALVAACGELGFPYSRMVSRAYHDSLFMSRIAPVAMLFIPCRGGLSHRPDEYAAPEDIARGSLVLAYALKKLAE